MEKMIKMITTEDAALQKGGNGNIRVVLRVRPALESEKQQPGYRKCVTVDSKAHSVTVVMPDSSALGVSNHLPQSRTFTFDYVADESISQENMYEVVGKPMTDACLKGYHCCLIAYGQTGAGKTYTMEGNVTSFRDMDLSRNAPNLMEESHGLIPRLLKDIFKRISYKKEGGVKFSVKCSCLQIYNDQVADLLSPESTNLSIHEDSKFGMYVEKLQQVEVQTAEETNEVFHRGSQNRHVAATSINKESSRSHGILILIVESKRKKRSGDTKRRVSRFYLVDLAGSERQKYSEATGVRLREANYINKSLSALGNVIKNALGGNSKCTLISNINPAVINIEETISTLKFAQRAKLICNAATINEDILGKSPSALDEMKRMKDEISAIRAKVRNGLSWDQETSSRQDQSAMAHIRRLESIISESINKVLAAEIRNAQEIRALARKVDETRAICDRLNRNFEVVRSKHQALKTRDSEKETETGCKMKVLLMKLRNFCDCQKSLLILDAHARQLQGVKK